ncbi:hypothetical protein TWF481_010179 [Arthrobotrys musiformis]|uniref:F-box domain-containing protein n=1 Tax=Arthrobotrys musiformis TaxID=47236 RepID=A0AAV9W231_9PEZI
MATTPSKMAILPTEILAQIITNETLSASDLGRCELVCRLFRDIVQHYARRHYTLKIGHPFQQTWRLARCLLVNPQIGKQFRSITVVWGRPQYVVTDTGTQLMQWSWTPEEKDQISTFAGGVLGKLGLRGIYWGVECGSLLPLLLCFMPNLESLDLGYPDIDTGLSKAYLIEQRRIIEREKICVEGAKLPAIPSC